MSPEVTVELIRVIPTLLWVAFAAVLIFIFRGTIERDVLPRIGEVKAFGIRVALIQVELEKAAVNMSEKVIEEGVSREKIPVISESERQQLLRRIKKVAPIIQGAQILWVDDNPDGNISERKILRSLGIFVDLAEKSREALSMIPQIGYDAVISDIRRPDLGEEGVNEFLTDIEKQDPKLSRSTIFYVTQLEPKMFPRAFGITNRPDELIHLVLDILERKRS